LNVEAVRQAIQNGVANGFFAYVGKTAQGDYSPFNFNQPLVTGDIELSKGMFIRNPYQPILKRDFLL
jgi:hypothetical protein